MARVLPFIGLMALLAPGLATVTRATPGEPPGIPATISFDGRRALPLTYRPKAAALVHLDGDSDPDLVVVNHGRFDDVYIGSVVQVFLDASAGFESSEAYAMPGGPSGLAICDFDGSGTPDLATANAAPDTLTVLLNDGQGGFTPGAAVSVGPDAVDVVCADFDGNGLPDLAAASDLAGQVSVALNVNGVVFAPAVPYPLGGLTPHLAAGDVDGDADVDLIGFATSGIFLLRNAGDASFGSPESLFSSGSFGPSELCDFDGDGDLDLMSASGVRLGSGDGSFSQTPITGPFGDQAARAHCVDFDADGHVDLVTREGAALGSGGSSLGPFLSFDPPPDPGPIAIGDVLGGPLPDLVRVHGGIPPDGSIAFATLIEGQGAAGLVPQPSDYGGDSVWDVATDPDLGVVILNTGPAAASVGVRPSLGDGTLGPLQLTGAGVTGRTVSLGDLDGDGHRDAVVPNFSSGQVSVLRADGAGGLLSAIPHSAGERPEDVAFGDLDGQAGLDMAVLSYFILENDAPVNSEITVLLSDGQGGFQAPITHVVPCQYTAQIVTAHLDADAYIDFAVACSVGSRGVAVGYGVGDGTFGGTHVLPTELGARALDRCDLDGDGDLDLVAMTHEPPEWNYGRIETFLNDGQGSFASGPSKALPFYDFRILCEDVSGDGIPDLALPYRVSSVVGVLPGLGDGGFGDGIFYEVGSEPRGVAFANLDGDARKDLVVANGGNNRVLVLLNTTPFPPATAPLLPRPALGLLLLLLVGIGRTAPRRRRTALGASASAVAPAPRGGPLRRVARPWRRRRIGWMDRPPEGLRPDRPRGPSRSA